MPGPITDGRRCSTSAGVERGSVLVKVSGSNYALMDARAVKNVDERECMRIVGAIGDALMRSAVRLRFSNPQRDR